MRDFLSRPLYHMLFILLLGFAAYSNTFDVPFQWDTVTYVEKNPYVQDLGRLFPPEAEEGKVYTSVKRRYIGYLTFALNYRAHGIRVPGYHAVNIAIHLANALMVYLLVILLYRTPFLEKSPADREHARLIALCSGLMFVAHPVQTEAVTYIFQRFSSLAAFFYLLSVTSYLGSRVRKAGMSRSLLYALALCSAVLGMKTKENVFTLPFTLALIEFLFLSGERKGRVLRLLPFALTMFIVPMSLSEYQTVKGGIIGGAISAIKSQQGASSLVYIFTQPRVIVTYLRLLFLPIGQNVDYDFPVFVSLFQTEVFASSLFLLALFISSILFITFSRSRSPELRVIGIGVLWFFIALSIESSIIPIPMLINEYRLYLPSVGFFIALSTGAALLMEKAQNETIKKSAINLLIIIPLVFAGATHLRNTIWKTPVSLWEDAVAKSPFKDRVHHNLGTAYMEIKNWEKAKGHLMAAARLDPKNPITHFNLGQIYEEQEMTEKAIRQYETVVSLNPKMAMAHNNLGVLYDSRGLTEKAIERYEAAIGLDPGYVAALNNLGLAYKKTGNPDKALEKFEAALELDPENPETHNNLGVLMASTEGYEKAIDHLKKAISLKPEEAKFHNNLGIAYARMGRKKFAIIQFKEALRVNPGYGLAQRNLDTLLKAGK